MTERTRIVFHFDMDHFFTAIEERERPELKGRPVVVGADPKGGVGRGVVSTSNYQAREFGVKSGLPISRAWKLCSNAIFLPVNYGLYVEVSNRIMEILRKYSKKFEQWGIDEAFLDVTSSVKDYASAEILARQIKHEIYAKEKLTCSVGIGPNKLIAKIASDFHKPDGLTVVRQEEVETFLSPLPVRRLLWVGRKTEQRLMAMGVKTIGDLALHDPVVLNDTFGELGKQLYTMAHGIDKSKVEERNQIKSVSRESTFQQDTDDFDFVLATIDKLAEDVWKDSIAKKVQFRTVTIKIRYENFETHTHSKTLSHISNRLSDAKKAARELVRPYFAPDRKIRLIGLRVSGLTSNLQQKTLIP